jgi:hypothetical protein
MNLKINQIKQKSEDNKEFWYRKEEEVVEEKPKP